MTIPHDLTLHHIGVATRGIERELPFFTVLGYRKVTDAFVEQGQKVRGMFIAAPGQPMLELLENLEAGGPLDAPLSRGVKFYHLAYRVENIETALERLLPETGGKIIVPAARSDFFHRICFVMLRNMALVELVEIGDSPAKDLAEPHGRET